MTQEEALTVLKSGANAFLTGEPGAGKTHTLNAYVTYLREHNIPVAITASTGIAATHIEGMTIHAWSGIGIKDALSPYEVEQIAGRERIAKRMAATKVLVIDEVSMLPAHTLMMVDSVLRAVRQSDEPFGGVQVVLVGDFFQLPPIARKGDTVQFAYEAPVWHTLGLLPLYLHEQYRQDDSSLLGLLASIRTGDIDDGVFEILESCKETNFYDGIEPTRLYTHNADVDRINSERLKELSVEEEVFEMEGRGARVMVDGLKKTCLSPEKLVLKLGAMVMCTKNNFDVGYVNGTLGQVVRFEEKTRNPVIETVDGDEYTIASASWSVSEGNSVLAEVTQIPLRLAWAITIHKSQGMSLDAADMDLSNAFEYGQGYVALSRVRSLQGLLLRGCNERALMVHPQVRMRDQVFREQSDMTGESFAAMSETEKEKMHKNFIVASGGTLEKVAIVPKEKIKDKVSTYEKTRMLVVDGKSIDEIAQARGMSMGTICTHLEKLIEDEKLSKSDMRHLRPKGSASKKHEAIVSAFKEIGDEALKPIREHLKRVYSYDDIHRARVLYRLEEGDA